MRVNIESDRVHDRVKTFPVCSREMKKKGRRRVNGDAGGSLTVEAAFVLPMVLMLTFALIYLSFYLHDLCRIRGITNGTLHQAALAYKHEVSLETGDIHYEELNERGIFYRITDSSEQEEKAMNYHIINELSEGLLLSRITAVDSEVRTLSLSVSVQVKTIVILPIFGRLFENFTYTKITGSYPLHDPAETVRACEVILHTGAQIKGAEQLKNRLQELLPAE